MRRRTKTYRKKRSRKYKKPFKKVAKKVRTYVKREIGRQLPNKKVQRKLEEQQFTNLVDVAYVYTLMPSIQQGVGQADRNGNTIRLKKAILRMCVTADNGYPNNFYCDMFIFTMKSGITPPTTGQLVRFLEDGNSAVGYQGRVLDGLRPLNRDLFTVKFRKRKVMGSLVVAGNGPNGGDMARATFTMQKDITSLFAKRWTYEDSANAPTNCNVFISIAGTDMAFQAVRIFGEFTFCVDFEFEDA